MVLASTSATIKVFLGAAVTTKEWSVSAAWADETTTTLTGGESATLTNGTTPVTLVASPAASTQRYLRSLHAVNRDNKLGVITVQYHDGTNGFRPTKVLLNPHDTLVWNPARGFYVIDVLGVIRTVPAAFQGSAVRMPPLGSVPAVGNLTLTSGTTFAKYLGRTDCAFSRAYARVNVATAGTSITWAEAGLATGAPVFNGNASLSLLAFTPIDNRINAIASVRIPFDLAGPAGLDLWLLIGSQVSGTVPIISACLQDTLQTGFAQSAVCRPSTMSDPQAFTLDGATAVGIYTTWGVM